MSPSEFKRVKMREKVPEIFGDENLLLIPWRKVCNSTTDVVELVHKIFRDIQSKKALPDFRIARHLKRGKLGALMNALILEPSLGGIGIDLKNIPQIFRSR